MNFVTCFSPAIKYFSQVRDKRKKEQREKKKNRLLRCISVWCFLLYCKKKRERKKTVSEISSLFVWSSPIKSLLYFKCTPVMKSFRCVISSIDSSSFARICFSVVSLSLILAKRLIATLKHYEGILEIWLKLIFFNLEVRFSAIWGGRKTNDLVVYVKGNWSTLPASEIRVSPN